MTANEEIKHYPGLDGLRGIAILLVVVYHYFSFFRIGWIGVDLFFVLSGFLITSILLRSRQKNRYFRNFYIRRALRIFPLYFLFLLVFFIGAALFFNQRDAGSAYAYYTAHRGWFLAFLQNWLIIKEGPPPEPYLIHFWSLAVEEQFYLFWPLIVFFAGSVRALKILLLILFFGALILRLFLWFYEPQNESFYYNSLARFDSLAAGSFLATLIYDGKRIFLSARAMICFLFVALIGTAALKYQSFEHNSFLFATIGYSISAAFFAVLCYAALNGLRLLHIWPLQFLGRISFGIYVFHLPVYLVATPLLKTKLDLTNSVQVYAIPLVSLMLTILVSFVSYHFLELPFLKLKSKFANYNHG